MSRAKVDRERDRATLFGKHKGVKVSVKSRLTDRACKRKGKEVAEVFRRNYGGRLPVRLGRQIS